MMLNNYGPNLQKSLTDDFPICKNTGIGYSTNQIYREDGCPQEGHHYEDTSCHFKFEEDFYLYGIFDGHEGKRAAQYCLQLMTTEIVYGRLHDCNSDQEIKDFLRQTFITVEKSYMESLNDLLAERASVLPEGANLYSGFNIPPADQHKLNQIRYQLSSGTAVAIVLIYKNKLYVANVGNCRVLLCQTDVNSVLKVVQLSVDHDLKNEDELLRLKHIGVQAAALSRQNCLGNQASTRCLGNYLVKGGFKDFDDFRSASQEPVIAEPDISGGIPLDESSRFLLLMSAGLYTSIEETGIKHVNQHIAQCVVDQFRQQSTLTGVAQAVVDKTVRLHHDWFMSNAMSARTAKREDITLVLRNFNFPLPQAINSPGFSTNTVTTNRTIDTNSSTGKCTLNQISPTERIAAYVDFAEFNKNFNKGKPNGFNK